MQPQALDTYISEIQQVMRQAESREHAYRPALKTLLESLNDEFIAINDPAQIDKVGAPDFVVKHKHTKLNVAYTEAKDIGVSLDRIEKTDQIERYLGALPNFILTDYIEFRWYLKGQHQRTASLGTLEKDGNAHRLVIDEDGVTAVRQLLAGYATEQIPTVHSAEELATTMADMTREIARIVEEGYEESTYLEEVKTAFEQTLIPNLNTRQFADMYAQTLAYGLFAARFEYDGEPENFTLHNAFWEVPESNPFLHEFFQQIARKIEDEAIEYQVNALVGLLANANTDKILEGFGKRTRQEDPIVHFYETFLAKYDPEQRARRGVYYTPEPVVSYIVRSVDHILKDTFDLRDGLADRSVTVLDPATGTGTFLYFVIQHIYERIVEKQGMKGAWGKYVQENLLPRIFGFELLVAPYAVAHMKLGIQLRDMLQKTGHSGKLPDRVHVYLTNTLEELGQTPPLPLMNMIAQEGEDAREIKHEKPIIVVLGNPPYSVSSANKGRWIENLMDTYKAAVRNEDSIGPLSNDYVKFIRFAHYRIEKTGHGIIAFISSNSYLDGLIHRGMRNELLKVFDEIYVLDLHGNSNRREKSPDGSPDNNVFDISEGVAICLLIKTPKAQSYHEKVKHFDLWGDRQSKYNWLNEHNVRSTDWQELKLQPPMKMFIPRTIDLLAEYENFPSVADAFVEKSMGVKTNRDHLLVDYEKHTIERKMSVLADPSIPEATVKRELNLSDSEYWNTARERKKIQSVDWESNIVPYHKTPFDYRWVMYQPNLIEIGRGGAGESIMKNFVGFDNIGLITTRQTKEQWGVILTAIIPSHKSVSAYDISSLFPLYIYPDKQANTLLRFDDDGSEWPLSDKGRRPNLSKTFVDEFAEKLGLKFITDGTDDLETTFGPEDILHYAYAVFHSPTYRERYAEFLKIDFPRLPLTSDAELFWELAGLGSELVQFHLMKHEALDTVITTFPEAGNNEVIKAHPKYDAKTRRVKINKEQYFEGVPEDVWNFYVGGYQVLEKWLKDRRGRELSFEDIMHYQRIVVALKETIRLMGEIDAAIPAWPVG